MWKGAVLFPKSISLRADGFLSRGSPPKQMYAFILMNADGLRDLHALGRALRPMGLSREVIQRRSCKEQ